MKKRAIILSTILTAALTMNLAGAALADDSTAGTADQTQSSAQQMPGSTLTGAVIEDETCSGGEGSGYANLYIDADSTWTVTGDSVLSGLSCSGTITDADGNSVTIVGTDGTVYAEGTSAYTVTVDSYTDSADLSGASAAESWESFAAEKPAELA